MKKLTILMLMAVGLACAGTLLAGPVLYEEWYNNGWPGADNMGTVDADPDGITVANAAWLAANEPSTVGRASIFAAPENDNGKDYWFGRITGWIVPPATGDYHFWVTSDDDSRVWLSSDDTAENRSMICWIDGWCGYADWAMPAAQGTGRQDSGAIHLEAGKVYYAQLVWSDGGGGGYGRVTWTGPAPIGDTRVDIASAYMRDVAWGASNPTPAYDEPAVPTGVNVLKWDKFEPSFGTIKHFDVYFGTEPNDLTVDHLPQVDVPTQQINSPALVNDMTYYWRVDSYVDDSNIMRGNWWRFNSVSWAPKINVDVQDVVFAPACDAELSIDAGPTVPGQGGTITYQWYKVGTPDQLLAGATTDTYLMSPGVEGQYYCIVSNDVDDIRSRTARVSLALNYVQHTDVGATTAAGDAYYESGNLVIKGDGDDIWNAADAFHFAYKEVSGDFDISARVLSISGGGNDWRKFGVMARDQLTAGSIHAYMAATYNNGNAWQGRRDTDTGNNGNSANVAGYGSGTFPYGWAQTWVRLRREGPDFFPYVSQDGVNWSQFPGRPTVDGEAINSPHQFAMADPIYVGLAVTSHEAGVLTTATFSDVMLNGEPMFALPWKVENLAVSPLTSAGWVPYDGDPTISWQRGAYTPCDGEFRVYVTQDMGNPGTAIVTTDTSLVLADATYGFEHDQTWYWRVDVYSPMGGGTQEGEWQSFVTVKWLPEIATNPATPNVADEPANVTLSCVVATLNDAAADLTSYIWKRVVGAKDTGLGGDDQVVFTNNSPVGVAQDGKKNWTCDVTLAINSVSDEGDYYCVGVNASGFVISANAWVITTRKVLHYTFESTPGDVVPDSSASGFNGKLVSPLPGGEPIYSLIDDGLGLGNALDVIGDRDPNGAFVDTGQKPSRFGINGGRPRTISAWVKARRWNNAGVFDMGAYANYQNFSWRTLGTLNQWRMQIWGSDRDITMNSFATWTHFVVTFDGTRCKVYANAQKVVDYAVPVNTSDASNVVVGRWQANGFDGRIDDFRIYDYALSPKEIGQLYVDVKGGVVCVEAPQYDRTGDCLVDLADFAELAAVWAESMLANP